MTRWLARIGSNIWLRLHPDVREIRHFHPTGKGMPNSVYVHRGGFLAECGRNAAAFEPSIPVGQRVEGTQRNGTMSQNGGVIVLPASTPTLLPPAIRHAGRMGHFFKGRYIDDRGTIFDERSTAIDIRTRGIRSLIRGAEEVCRTLQQEVVLVKDFETGRIFLVGRKSSASSRPGAKQEVLP